MSLSNEGFFLAVQAGLVAKGEGLPGIAKTATIQAFAKSVGRSCYILIGSLREPADIGGYPYPVDGKTIATEEVKENGKTVGHIALLAPKWAADTWNGDKWLVVFDEITTCPPAVQAAMLRVLAEKVVGDLALPEDTWMAALSNPTGIAANGFELEPPMANRMVHFRWEMDWDSWEQGISAGMKFPAPKFRSLPSDWKDKLGYWGSMVAAFRKHKSDCFELPTDRNGQITCERSKLSGAYPTPRSWTMGVQCLAAADAAGADRMVQSQMLHGCVGYDVAYQFETWVSNLDLPDAEETLKAAVACRKSGVAIPMPAVDRPDKIIAFLATLADRVVGKKDDPTRWNAERWEASIEIIEKIGQKYADVALTQARPFAANIPPGAKIPDVFRNTMFPLLFKAFKN